MAKMTARMRVTSDLITGQLESMISEFYGGNIEAGLSIDEGFEHWWLQEFGAGQYHDNKNVITVPPDGQITIHKPRKWSGNKWIARIMPVFTTGNTTSRIPMRWKATDAETQKSLGKQSIRSIYSRLGWGRYAGDISWLIRPIRAKVLAFMSGGRIVYRKSVHHPGFQSKGFLRKNIFTFLKQMNGAFNKLVKRADKTGQFPTHKELVQVTNALLMSMNERIRQDVPVDDRTNVRSKSRPDIGHLRDAIHVRLAK